MTTPVGQEIGQPEGRLAGRLALITGASRGIGAAVAKAFAREGAHVILTARTQGGLEDVDDEIRRAGHETPTLFPADLTDLDLIDQMGASLYERFGRLDILVANAGILGPLSPVSHIDQADWDRVLAANLTVNYRLIRALEPLLKLSPAGRAIFVTSGAAEGHYAYWGAYAVSKGGLEVLVRTWAQELENTPVRVNLLNPGGTRTRMRAEAFPGEDPLSLPTPEQVAETFIPLAETACTLNGATVQAREGQAA
ncbi:MAG: NAD(P)-dependent dehydrogenase (short-subunit alcohol dehydrogenase family) [Alphaproteobacteria bacterium]|jgi:NAD(P)-dependent dehydrogenase (short-subunit alcohol dehydrogenase family)